MSSKETVLQAFHNEQDQTDLLARMLARAFCTHFPDSAIAAQYLKQCRKEQVALYHWYQFHGIKAEHSIDCEVATRSGEQDHSQCPCWCHQVQPELDIHFYRQTE